ncbi:serine-rich adhesin for platelets-like [Cherax quadricarinatus]|uniref:serine-rich adhesin for platelets-like n=1 Tax=Cherax quadricarinatus TaxID=27406 RepID=UPI00387EC261
MLPSGQHHGHHNASSPPGNSSRRQFEDFDHISKIGRRESYDKKSVTSMTPFTENGNFNKLEKMEKHNRKLKVKQRRSSSKSITSRKEFNDLCSSSNVGRSGSNESVVLTPEPDEDEAGRLQPLSSWKSVQVNLNEEFKMSQKAKLEHQHQERSLSSWKSYSALQSYQNNDDNDVPKRRQPRHLSPSPEVRKSVSFEIPQFGEVMRYPPEEQTKAQKEYHKSKDNGNEKKKTVMKGLSQKPQRSEDKEQKLPTVKKTRSSPLPFLRKKKSDPGTFHKRELTETSSLSSVPFLRKKKFDFDAKSSIKSGGSHLSEHLGKLSNLKANLHMLRSHKVGEPRLTGFTKDCSEFPQLKTCSGDGDSHSITSVTSIESSASATNKIRHTKFGKRWVYEIPDTSYDFRVRSPTKIKSKGPLRAFRNIMGMQSKSVIDLSALEKASSSGLSRSYDDILKENNYPTQEEFLVDPRILTLSHEGIEPGDFDDDADYYRSLCRLHRNSLLGNTTSVTGKISTSKSSSEEQAKEENKDKRISMSSDEQDKQEEERKDKKNRNSDNSDEDERKDINFSQSHGKVSRTSSVHDIILKYEGMEQFKSHNTPASDDKSPRSSKSQYVEKSLNNEEISGAASTPCLKQNEAQFSADATSHYEKDTGDLNEDDSTDWETSVPSKDCKSSKKKHLAGPRFSPNNSPVKANNEDERHNTDRFAKEEYFEKGTLGECIAKCDARKENRVEEELQRQDEHSIIECGLQTHVNWKENEKQLVSTHYKSDLKKQETTVLGAKRCSNVEKTLAFKDEDILGKRMHNDERKMQEYEGESSIEKRGNVKKIQKGEGKTIVKTSITVCERLYDNSISDSLNDPETNLSPTVPQVIVTTDTDSKAKETGGVADVFVYDTQTVSRKISDSRTSESTDSRKQSTSRNSMHEESPEHSTIQQSLSASSTDDSGFFSSLHRLVMKNNSVSSNEEQPSLKQRIVKKLSSVSSFEDREITDETLGKVPRKPSGKKKTPPKRPPPPKLVFDKFNSYNQYLTVDTAPVPQTPPPPPPKPPRLFQILSGYRRPADSSSQTEAQNYRRFSLVDSDLDMIRSGRPTEESIDELDHQDSATDAETDGDDTYKKFPLVENSDDESLLDYPLSPEPEDIFSFSASKVIPDSPLALTAQNSFDSKEDDSSGNEDSAASPHPLVNDDTCLEAERTQESPLHLHNGPPDSDDKTRDGMNSEAENNTELDTPFPFYDNNLVEKIVSPVSEYDNFGSGQWLWSLGRDEQYAETNNECKNTNIKKPLALTSGKKEARERNPQDSPKTLSDIEMRQNSVPTNNSSNIEPKLHDVQLQQNAAVTVEAIRTTDSGAIKGESRATDATVETNWDTSSSDIEVRTTDAAHGKMQSDDESSEPTMLVENKDLNENLIPVLLSQTQSRDDTPASKQAKHMESKLKGLKIKKIVADTGKLTDENSTSTKKEEEILVETKTDSIYSDFKVHGLQYKDSGNTAMFSLQKEKNFTEENKSGIVYDGKRIFKTRKEATLNVKNKVLPEEAVSRLLKKSRGVEAVTTDIKTNITELQQENQVSSCRETNFCLRESPSQDAVNRSSSSTPSPTPVPAPRISKDLRPVPTPRTSKPSSTSSSRPTSAMSTTSDRPLLAMFFEKLLDSHNHGETRRISMSVEKLSPRESLLSQDENTLSKSEGYITKKEQSETKYCAYEDVNVSDVREWKLKTSLDSSTFSDSVSICDSYKSEANMNLQPEYSPVASRRCLSENELVRIPGSAEPSPSLKNSTQARPHPRPRPSLTRSKAIILSSDEEDTHESGTLIMEQEPRRSGCRRLWVRRGSDSLLSGSQEAPLPEEDPIGLLKEAGYSGDTEDDEEVSGCIRLVKENFPYVYSESYTSVNVYTLRNSLPGYIGNLIYDSVNTLSGFYMHLKVKKEYDSLYVGSLEPNLPNKRGPPA